MPNFTFTEISSPPPYGIARQASINNSGTVAFEGFLSRALPPTSIFTADSSGQTTPIVDNSAVFFQRGLVHAPVVTSLNDAGIVAYAQTDLDQNFIPRYNGVFTSNRKAAIIDSTNSPYSFFWGPAINNKGTVAFLAGQGNPTTGQAGIFTISNGTLTNIADSSGVFSQFNVGFNTIRGNSPLSNYTVPSINESATVAFNAGLDVGGQGIFTGNSKGTTTIADSTGVFDLFSSADINNQGTVAFLAQLDDQSTGVFTSTNGQITTLVDTSSGFSSFLSDPSLNNQGKVAFQATLDNGITGIFTGSDPIANKVIGVGDELFGSTVTNLLITQQGLNDQGQLSFAVGLADGRESIVFAQPVPEPGEGIVLVWALGIMFILGWRRRMQSAKPNLH